MQDDYIGRQIDRATRSLFLLSIFPLIAVSLLGVQNRRFLVSLIHSPVPMSSAEIQQVSDPESLRRYNVSLIGDQLIPTKFQKVRETRDQHTNQVTRSEVEQRFSILTLGNKSLLVSSKNQISDTQLKGGLLPIPLEVRDHVLNAIERKKPELAGTFLPMMLDTETFSSDAWFVPTCGALLILLGFWGLITAARWSSNPAGHPIAKELQKRGEFNIVRGRIDAEVRAEGGSGSGTLITASWLLSPSLIGLKIRPLGEIAWAYKLVVRHRVNFIPVGKTVRAKIWDRQGKAIEVMAKEANVDALLTKINQRAPWVVMGFNAAIESMFKMNRPQFLAEVDKRKAALKAAPVAGPASPQPQAKRPTPVGVA
jgi:hypothetical protein